MRGDIAEVGSSLAQAADLGQSAGLSSLRLGMYWDHRMLIMGDELNTWDCIITPRLEVSSWHVLVGFCEDFYGKTIRIK